jgi:hypothetical protein
MQPIDCLNDFFTMLPTQHVVVETQTREADVPIEKGNNTCRTFSEELRLAEGVA